MRTTAQDVGFYRTCGGKMHQHHGAVLQSDNLPYMSLVLLNSIQPRAPSTSQSTSGSSSSQSQRSSKSNAQSAKKPPWSVSSASAHLAASPPSYAYTLSKYTPSPKTRSSTPSPSISGAWSKSTWASTAPPYPLSKHSSQALSVSASAAGLARIFTTVASVAASSRITRRGRSSSMTRTVSRMWSTTCLNPRTQDHQGKTGWRQIRRFRRNALCILRAGYDTQLPYDMVQRWLSVEEREV